MEISSLPNGSQDTTGTRSTVPAAHGDFIQETPPSYDTAANYSTPQSASSPPSYLQVAALALPLDEITSPTEAPPSYPESIP